MKKFQFKFWIIKSKCYIIRLYLWSRYYGGLIPQKKLHGSIKMKCNPRIPSYFEIEDGFANFKRQEVAC